MLIALIGSSALYAPSIRMRRLAASRWSVYPMCSHAYSKQPSINTTSRDTNEHVPEVLCWHQLHFMRYIYVCTCVI
jgi:hypothetical protein